MSLDPIEIIIRADLYGLMLLDGVRKGSAHEPIAQNTTLGWIISGPVDPLYPESRVSVHVHHGNVLETLDFNIRL